MFSIKPFLLSRALRATAHHQRVVRFATASGEVCGQEERTSSYPEWRATTTLALYRHRWDDLPAAAREPEEEVFLAGRVTSRRDASSKLVFLTISGGEGAKDEVQVLADRGLYDSSPGDHDDFDTFRQSVRRGDVIGVRGFPGKSGRGELSIIPREISLLAPCLRRLPGAASEKERIAAETKKRSNLKNKQSGGIQKQGGREKAGDPEQTASESDSGEALLLRDPEQRYKHRYLDLLVNGRLGVSSRFVVRARIIEAVRSFLSTRGFLEVETPVLSAQPGGASAEPFVTRAKSFGSEADGNPRVAETETSLAAGDARGEGHGQGQGVNAAQGSENTDAFGSGRKLYMRIAPELYLKQLVVGGFDRVFELGKVFRNEGVTAAHNPEFTTCEFYQAYANYEDLMTTTEELLADIVRVAKHEQGIDGEDDLVVEVPVTSGGADAGDGGGEAFVAVDFAPPFRRIAIIPELERHTGAPIRDWVAGANAFDDPELQRTAVANLSLLCDNLGVACPEPRSAPRLFDKLIGHFIEPECVQPTFVCDHPICMSPLAKAHGDDREGVVPGTVQRFELFVAGTEICNSYTELNDPEEQRRRFLAQASQRDAGDAEAHGVDEVFCSALEYGLPPTAGWGMGIDRLCMMLTRARHIRDVIMFPAVK